MFGYISLGEWKQEGIGCSLSSRNKMNPGMEVEDLRW